MVGRAAQQGFSKVFALYSLRHADSEHYRKPQTTKSQQVHELLLASIQRILQTPAIRLRSNTFLFDFWQEARGLEQMI